MTEHIYVHMYMHVCGGVSIKHRWQMVIIVFSGKLRVKEMSYTQPLSVLQAGLHSTWQRRHCGFEQQQPWQQPLDLASSKFWSPRRCRPWHCSIGANCKAISGLFSLQEPFVDTALDQALQNYIIFIKKQNQKSRTSPKETDCLGDYFPVEL